MNNLEIIQEVKNIKIDFTENKITISEVMGALKIFSIEVKKDFSTLYNAFYSSKPELYIN